MDKVDISVKHPDYNANVNKWLRCRDCMDGTDAVKSRGEVYLPKLEGQTNREYDAYLTRGLFFEIASRTKEGLIGMALRKAMRMVYPDDAEEYFVDTSSTGISLVELVKNVVDETLTVGRVGLLLDRPMDGGRAYIAPYTCEDIINWRTTDNGALTLLVLREYEMSQDEHNPYKAEWSVLYRELALDSDGLYVFRLWRKNSQGSYEPGTWHMLTNRGRPIDYIPFVIITSEGITWDIPKPPMLGIVDINLSHYRTSCDLEHGRHFTALPTPVVTGIAADNVLKIGSTTAWSIPDQGAKAYYLEFTGQGLLSLENAMKEKERQMAAMSAKMVDSNTRGSEAAETVRLRFSSEASVMVGVIAAIEAGLKKIYSILQDIEDFAGDISIEMNKKFLDESLTASEIRAWVEAYQSGSISEEVFLFNLERGEALPHDYDPEDLKRSMSRLNEQHPEN